MGEIYSEEFSPRHAAAINMGTYTQISEPVRLTPNLRKIFNIDYFEKSKHRVLKSQAFAVSSLIKGILIFKFKIIYLGDHFSKKDTFILV